MLFRSHYLRQRLDDQEDLIRALLNYFGAGEHIEPDAAPEEEPQDGGPPPGIPVPWPGSQT